MKPPSHLLPPDWGFGSDRQQEKIAHTLYEQVVDLPLLCPHGHVDPRLFSEADYSFGNPTELIIAPDHYLQRMLYSQGIPPEKFGISRQGSDDAEQDPRKIWQTFADHFYLFRGTPSGIWLTYELQCVFGIQEKLGPNTAQSVYDQISARLSISEFKPRALYNKFNIEVLCTTDSATDTLAEHSKINASQWDGRILPTFRPDELLDLCARDWLDRIDRLGQLAGVSVANYRTFLQAVENRRVYFKKMGSTASDIGAQTAFTCELSQPEAEAIFQRALRRQASDDDSNAFTAHMLMEMARMSIDDGLVMQLHVGSCRNHNTIVDDLYGSNRGGDIPVRAEFTHNLRPLLNQYGNDPHLTLILFTLDESAYARELAPLAGHYPAVKLGPPWWFHDSPNGMRRYFDQVMETAGLYNTVGFNDDTRALCSIPARHDLWRRTSANWVAGLLIRRVIDMEDASEMMLDLSYRLTKTAYKL